MAESWYVIQSQPMAESRALVNLARQGFIAYLPTLIRERRHARRVELVSRPLFARYLFVQLDLARDRWRAIDSTFGVSRLIQVCDRPAPLPCGFVDELRAHEGPDGNLVLGLAPGLAAGSSVRLVAGAFADCIGIIERIDDRHRVAILLELLGREVRVFVSPNSVTAA